MQRSMSPPSARRFGRCRSASSTTAYLEEFLAAAALHNTSRPASDCLDPVLIDDRLARRVSMMIGTAPDRTAEALDEHNR